MEITHDIGPFMEEMAALAYERYRLEFDRHPWLAQRPRESFEAFFREKSSGMEGAFLTDGGGTGFILYTLREDDECAYCDVPVWGCGASGEHPDRAAAYLFQAVAERVVRDKPVNFSVRLYAGDAKIQRVFSMMQFGFMAQRGIRPAGAVEHSGEHHVRRLEKAEVERRWGELWGLLEGITGHLKKSPVFYPGTEFTQGAYREFFLDPGTRVYAAMAGERLIGLIEANDERAECLPPDIPSANVGEAYVLPEYRGSGAAQALLNRLDEDLRADGVQYEWLDHGTANPAARGFWGRYFHPLEYELTRTVEPVRN